MRLMTIGFTKTTAEHFFGRLLAAEVRSVVDVRLNNTSQLAGFAKESDLRYFLRAIGEIGYLHLPELAPTQDMIDAYRKEKGDWSQFATRFLALMEARKVESRIDPAVLADGCLLCSEDKPHHCHRRLVAEYLQQKWSVPVEIRHL
jgi:uncharacterized protein (DUF488 family)